MAHHSDSINRLPDLHLDTLSLDSAQRKAGLTDNGGKSANRKAQEEYLEPYVHDNQHSAFLRTQEDVATSIEHTHTPPINVPSTDTTIPNDEILAESQSTYAEDSSLDDFIRTRNTSISFNPQVKLESGHQHMLGEPVRKPSDRRPRVRGRSLLQELSDQKVRSPAGRAHSESDRIHYDPITGQLLGNRGQNENAQERLKLRKGEMRHPLLQETVDALVADATTRPEDERPTSLISESTVSPAMEEVCTPPDTNQVLWSPVSVESPLPHAKSFDESSPWNANHALFPTRARSYNSERNVSMRSAVRANSRRSTSSSFSPASAFLSQWSHDDTPAQPDDEGQQVGEDYVLGKQIGFGGFSTVKEAFTFEGGGRIRRAVKIVRKIVSGKDDRENEEAQAEFEHEVSLWRHLRHKHILPLIAVYETDFATFCFIPLHSGGTLFDLVRRTRKQGGLSNSVAKRYSYQLASAIRYLHEDVRVVHRDIKLENCLLDVGDPAVEAEGGNVILCDFGMAEFLTGDHRDSSPDPYENAADRPPPRNIGPAESSTSIAGSLQYASPELISTPGGLLDPITDIWAFGVVVFALLVGDLPFQHTFQPRVQMMILSGDWKRESLSGVNGTREEKDDALELVKSCLEMKVESRWTIREILDCPWFRDCEDESDDEMGNGWNL